MHFVKGPLPFPAVKEFENRLKYDTIYAKVPHDLFMEPGVVAAFTVLHGVGQWGEQNPSLEMQIL